MRDFNIILMLASFVALAIIALGYQCWVQSDKLSLYSASNINLGKQSVLIGQTNQSLKDYLKVKGLDAEFRERYQ